MEMKKNLTATNQTHPSASQSIPITAESQSSQQPQMNGVTVSAVVHDEPSRKSSTPSDIHVIPSVHGLSSSHMKVRRNFTRRSLLFSWCFHNFQMMMKMMTPSLILI